MKATRAGPVLGQAMTGHSLNEIGTVMAFVKNGTTLGDATSLYDDILPGLSTDLSPEQRSKIQNGKVLQELLIQRPASESDVVDVFADRITAGLSVITPLVVADTVRLNQIETASTSGILNILLDENGIVNISSGNGDPKIQFDSQGNATFSGTLTASRLQVKQLDGLELLIDQRLQQGSTQSGSTNTSESLFDSATPAAQLSGLPAYIHIMKQGTDTVTEWLEVVRQVIFRSPVEFFGTVFFRKAVVFNNDTAGTAVVPELTTSVEVKFKDPYEIPPIVTISLNLQEATDSAFMAEGANAAVANVNREGFTIVLDAPVPRDMIYSWVAIAVKDPRNTVGRRIIEQTTAQLDQADTVVLGEQSSVTPSATLTPTVIITPSPVLFDSMIPVLTPTPVLLETSDSSPSAKQKDQEIQVNITDLGFVRLRSEPNAESNELGQIPSGTTLEYLQEQYAWYQVFYAGQTGWVSGIYVTRK